MMKTHASKKSRKVAARSGPGRKTSRKSKGPIGPTARGVSLDRDGLVVIERAVEELRMSKARLAETFGIAPVTLQRKARAAAPKTQRRLLEGLEIIRRVSDWAGGPVQAMAWYRAEPIPAFGGRTAEALVKDGKAAAVRDYLDRVALGGFV
jgi:Antitoxin Xre/MbcA/ParS C-terminal toxin-binding domain